MSEQPEIDAAVFSTNKCLEALPGVAFAVARIDRLLACAGNPGSWSFDLTNVCDQAMRNGWGSFRFTPPARVLSALVVALDYHEAEGQSASLARYTANIRILHDGMRDLSLTPWPPASRQGAVIVVAHAPADPAWNAQAFVDTLKLRGILISNFFNTTSPTFRVGCIGAITPDDMAGPVQVMGHALRELGIKSRGTIQT